MKKNNTQIPSRTFSPRDSSRSSCLSKDFYYELLGQEELYKKHKTRQGLTKLIQLYRKMVEFYSQRNDNILIYFTDKISNLSSQIPNLQQPQQRLTISMARQVQLEDQRPEANRFNNSKSLLVTPPKYDPEIKKKQRSKNAQIAIEVSKVKKRANARTILNSYYEQSNDLQQQRKQLEQKLNAIHNRSIESGKGFKQTVL